MECDTLIFQQNQSKIDFSSAVSMGLVKGVIPENKFGHCPDAAAVATDVWERGAAQPLYIFPDSSGEALEMVSANALDTQEIVVIGLDEAGIEKVEVLALTGTTPVPLPGLWSAVNRAFNDGSTPVLGEVLVQGDGTTSINIFAAVCSVCQQTSQAIYTVPSNKVAVVRSFVATMNKPLGATVAAIFALQTARPGKVFRTQARFGLQENGTSNQSFDLPVSGLAGPSFKIKFVAEPSSGPADLSAQFSLLIVEKELIPKNVLAALGA